MRLKIVNESRAHVALELFNSLPIKRYSHQPLAPRIWALRENMTAYDAAYFALAEVLRAPLWTRDTKYVGAPMHSAEIVVV